MSEVVSPLVFQLGVEGIGGFIVGYALKKLSKLKIGRASCRERV